MRLITELACTAGLAALLFMAFGQAGDAAGDAERQFGLALAMLLAAVLVGGPERRRSPGAASDLAAVAAWSAGCAFIAAASMLLLRPGTGASALAPGLGALGVFASILLVGAARSLLEAAGTHRDTASMACAVAVLLNLSAPLWLGSFGNAWPELGEFSIRFSFMGYLAAMCDYDVARSGWLYRQSAVAGIGRSYPDPGLATTTLLAVAAAGLSVADHLRQRRHAGQSDPLSHPLTPPREIHR